jgi:hypothetical protein
MNRSQFKKAVEHCRQKAKIDVGKEAIPLRSDGEVCSPKDPGSGECGLPAS